MSDAARPVTPDTHPAGHDVDPRVTRSRAKVLEAAGELLVEGGPAALTVDAVSARSGVAKTTLYRHWESRTALLIDVMREAVPAIPDADLSLGFEPSLRAYVDSLAHLLDEPRWARLLPALFLAREDLTEVEQLTVMDRRDKVTSLTAVLQLGVDEGRLPADIDAELVAATLFGPIMMTVLTGEGDAEAVAHYAVDRFLSSYPDGSGRSVGP